MRYRLKAPDLNAYQGLLAMLAGRRIPVRIASEKRRLLAVDDLPEDLHHRFEASGVEVGLDLQYAVESASHPGH